MRLAAPFAMSLKSNNSDGRSSDRAQQELGETVKKNFDCLEQTSCEQFDIASDQSPMVSVIGRGGYCYEYPQKTLAWQGEESVFG